MRWPPSRRWRSTTLAIQSTCMSPTEIIAAAVLSDNAHELAGVPAAEGIAFGPAYVYRTKLPQVVEVVGADPQHERHRLETAIAAVTEHLTNVRASMLQRVGAGEASIFDAHLLMVRDAELLQAALQEIELRRVNAEAAWQRAIQTMATRYQVLTDPYMARRADDIIDVGQRVLRVLAGTGQDDTGLLMDEAAILVAHELKPSDLARVRAGPRTGHHYRTRECQRPQRDPGTGVGPAGGHGSGPLSSHCRRQAGVGLGWLNRPGLAGARRRAAGGTGAQGRSLGQRACCSQAVGPAPGGHARRAAHLGCGEYQWPQRRCAGARPGGGGRWSLPHRIPLYRPHDAAERRGAGGDIPCGRPPAQGAPAGHTHTRRGGRQAAALCARGL